MFISNRIVGDLFVEHECALPLHLNRFEILRVDNTYYVRIGSMGIHWGVPAIFRRNTDKPEVSLS